MITHSKHVIGLYGDEVVTAGRNGEQAPRVVILQLAESDPPGRLVEWLRAEGLEPDVRSVHVDGHVPDSDGLGALIVLGGPMGAGDDARVPYLPAVRALLREAVTAQVPLLAVCLGAQLLAAAHGGQVEPNPEGPELGAQLIAKRSSAATDPLFGPLPITPDVVQWHYDAIRTLPAGAIQLASSPLCENQAYRLGRLAWGLQFHIETTPQIVHAWARADAPRLADYDLDAILARADAVHVDIAEVWQPFVAAFAGIVRDPGAVPEPRGVRSSTAAPVTDPAAIRAALAAEAQAAHGGHGGHGGYGDGPHRLPMPQRRPDRDG
jgi:GMP synthase-like glutamine amidotransferase